MIVRSYIRPVGRLTRPPARINTGPDKLVRIGSRDDLIFAGLELLQRHADRAVERSVLTPQETMREVARGGATGEQLKTALAALAVARPSIAGVPLDRPRLMGIVNVTPDSFSDGGTFSSAREAVAFAHRLVDEGADFIDIGGESTRPGSEPLPLDEELRRVMPVIEGLIGNTRARISVDTRKAEVMRQAARAGAHMLNDVSALSHDPASLRAAADTGLPIVLMHAQGDPKTMQQDPHYRDVLLDVFDALAARIDVCTRAGIARERLIVDPGIGFGKTLAHNLELMAGLSLFHALGTPVLLGASRKSMIGSLTGAVDPSERIPGSIATALAAAAQGANILRVHDVAATRQALTVWEAVTCGRPPTEIAPGR